MTQQHFHGTAQYNAGRDNNYFFGDVAVAGGPSWNSLTTPELHNRRADIVAARIAELRAILTSRETGGLAVSMALLLSPIGLAWLALKGVSMPSWFFIVLLWVSAGMLTWTLDRFTVRCARCKWLGKQIRKIDRVLIERADSPAP